MQHLLFHLIRPARLGFFPLMLSCLLLGCKPSEPKATLSRELPVMHEGQASAEAIGMGKVRIRFEVQQVCHSMQSHTMVYTVQQVMGMGPSYQGPRIKPGNTLESAIDTDRGIAPGNVLVGDVLPALNREGGNSNKASISKLWRWQAAN